MSKLLATTIAEFCAGLTYADIPQNVRDAAMMHVVDLIGVCLAGANPSEESGMAARALVKKWSGADNSSIFGLDTRLGPDKAALLNGALAQALEMDDKHGSSLARPGSTVTPAVLAIAEAGDMNIKQAITATVAGYEVMIRLGFVGGDRFLARGYHTSSLLGPFGSAAAIGNLTGASSSQIVDALGISGTFASGIQESTRTGSMSKILHGGWGAQAGMIALDLAQAGISGPESVFEGDFGFFQTHLTPITGKLDFDKGGAGYGQHWYLPETGFKPYPCCQLLHAFIEAVKQLLVEFESDGVTINDITAITCKLAEPGLTLVTEPRNRKKAPQTPHEGRFSLPFGVASALIDGEVSLETFRKERLGDDAVLKLAALVEAEEDPDSDYPQHCPAILEIKANGKQYRAHVLHHPGCPEAPLLRDDVLDKFARNSGWKFGNSARNIGEALLDIDHNEKLSAMIAHMKPAESAARGVE